MAFTNKQGIKISFECSELIGELLTYRINAQEINIYRAGDFGCIIQTIGKH